MRFDLPNGSQFLTMQFFAPRPIMPVGDRSSWHLAQGIGVIEATTHQLIAWKLISQGSSPRRATVENNGTQIAHQEFVGPDAPFTHVSNGLVPNLAPGSYYVIAFGTDGDSRLPNPGWGGSIEVSDTVSCSPIGEGEIGDKDQTDFSGGTQAMVYGAGVAQDESLKLSSNRPITFGLMDAATQFNGQASLSYSIPGAGAGTITNSIVPFIASSGMFSFSANYSGLFPLISIDYASLSLN